jgi:hypothetical protein
VGWLGSYGLWSVLTLGGSLILSVGGLLVVRWLIVSLPVDYFAEPARPALWRHSHPALRWSWFAVKNVLGVALVAAGAVMVVIPGPGVVTILLGLSLLSMPGKRGLILKLLRNPHVIGLMNELRTRADQPLLIVPHE